MERTNATIIVLITLTTAAIYFANARAVADDSTMPSAPTTDPSTTQAADDSQIPVIDADVIYKAFKSNEVRAASDYSGVIEVSGTVRRIALDIENQPVVELAGDTGISAVDCVFKPQLTDDATMAAIKALNVGDKVIIGGNIESPFVISVRLQALEMRKPDAAAK